MANPNYYLSIEYKNDAFKLIKELPTSLRELNQFTQCYDNEKELKDFLLEKGYITGYDYVHKINIRYKNLGEMGILPNRLSYKIDRDFFEPAYLLQYLNILFNENDLTFLNNLCKYYHKDSSTNNLYHYLECLKNGLEYGIEEEIPKSQIMNDFFTKLCFDKKGKINYKRFHILAVYVSRYEKEFKDKNKDKELENDKSRNILVKKLNNKSSEINLFKMSEYKEPETEQLCFFK